MTTKYCLSAVKDYESIKAAESACDLIIQHFLQNSAKDVEDVDLFHNQLQRLTANCAIDIDLRHVRVLILYCISKIVLFLGERKYHIVRLVCFLSTS